jgi:hypothetical protein
LPVETGHRRGAPVKMSEEVFAPDAFSRNEEYDHEDAYAHANRDGYGCDPDGGECTA